jgi:hypothetical protein
MSIPNDMQAEGAAAMNLLFDFYKRKNKVRFYKAASEVVLSEDPNWNSDFGDAYTSNILKTAQSEEFECRYWFVKDYPLIRNIDGDDNSSVNVSIPKGKVRLQMKSDAYEYLKEVKTFWIEGMKYIAFSDFRMVGIFSEFQFYEILLEKSN